MDRPEYEALARLYGPDHVIDAVYTVLVESTKPYQIGLRTRCWELLHRLGQRQRLLELLAGDEGDPDDLMLADLRAAAIELHVVPRTREEILWVRKLRQPEHAAYWSQAAGVVYDLPDARLAQLELRDLLLRMRQAGWSEAALHETVRREIDALDGGRARRLR